jgi:hypothetical protein
MRQLSRSDKLRLGVSIVATVIFVGGAIQAIPGHRWGTVVILAIAGIAAILMALGTLSRNPKIHRFVSNDWLVKTWRNNNERWRAEERGQPLQSGRD